MSQLNAIIRMANTVLRALSTFRRARAAKQGTS